MTVERLTETRTRIVCPECKTSGGKVVVVAPATVLTAMMVTAEIDLDVDLAPKNIRVGYRGARELVSFRLDTQEEVLDSNLDHYSLEVDDERAIAYCYECQAEVTTQWKAVLDAPADLRLVQDRRLLADIQAVS